MHMFLLMTALMPGSRFQVDHFEVLVVGLMVGEAPLSSFCALSNLQSAETLVWRGPEHGKTALGNAIVDSWIPSSFSDPYHVIIS